MSHSPWHITACESLLTSLPASTPARVTWHPEWSFSNVHLSHHSPVLQWLPILLENYIQAHSGAESSRPWLPLPPHLPAPCSPAKHSDSVHTRVPLGHTPLGDTSLAPLTQCRPLPHFHFIGEEEAFPTLPVKFPVDISPPHRLSLHPPAALYLLTASVTSWRYG